MNPTLLKVVAVALLVSGLIGAYQWRISAAYEHGHETAIAERAASDLKAVTRRVTENAAIAVKQTADNAVITKAKNEELTPVRARIAAAPRLRVGTGVCNGSAAATEAQSPASGDSGDPAGRLVREDVDRDIRALKLKVEEGFATGRACQAFLDTNGFVP
jgi:prophage endopeptidase